jgi:hypothetical protein
MVSVSHIETNNIGSSFNGGGKIFFRFGCWPNRKGDARVSKGFHGI